MSRALVKDTEKSTSGVVCFQAHTSELARQFVLTAIKAMGE